ncbi:DsbA family oxidoreductase [Streptomyces sp. NPDC050418]|uniref:DsbA family oxidoreductase n=1 Tax=Streptomyces sp. NPDC050418 TaxID=3365612 RepID=UPI0037A5CABA
MRIDFWADVICPWCYLGHARLRTALDRFPHRDAVRVVHRSFELDPGRAKEDITPVPSFLTARYGPDAAAMDKRVARIVHGEGLGYRTDRQVGSTLDAHRLLHWAGEQHRQEQLLQAMMRANFAQARDIFTPEGLLAIVGEAGLDAAEATAALADPQWYLACASPPRPASPTPVWTWRRPRPSWTRPAPPSPTACSATPSWSLRSHPDGPAIYRRVRKRPHIPA